MVTSLARRSSLDSLHFARSMPLHHISYPLRTVLSSIVETKDVEPWPIILGMDSKAGVRPSGDGCRGKRWLRPRWLYLKK